jgi:signal transduction histidine kinase
VTERTARLIAWPAWTACVGAVVVFTVIGIVRPTSRDVGFWAPEIGTMLFLLAFSTVGALLVSRRWKNPIGWLLLASGLCFALGGVAVTVDPNSRNAYAQWLSSWTWGTGTFLALTLPFLLFPDGHLLSRRWRPVAWASVAGIGAFAIGSAFAPGVSSHTQLENPFGLALGGVGRTLFPILRAGSAFAIVGSILAVTSLVLRYRRAEGGERAQLRWLLFAGAVVVLSILAQIPLQGLIASEALRTNIDNAITASALALMPIAIGIAILKYRLYDLDLVIRKTVVVGAMALFITLIYALIVGLGSQLFHSSVPSFLAAAVLAVGFQPARDRARKLADRLVYGKRATPYEVLANFSGRMGEAYAADDVLPRMAQVLAAGTGADVAVVWLRLGDVLHPSATFPADARPPTHPPEDAVEVLHQGERLGALSVVMPASDPMNPSRRKLVEDLAAQAGLVLRNVRLIEELRASRQRLVAAQDEERRRLERNLHDGAQQQLVALAVQLKLARTMLDRDVTKAGELLEGLQLRAGDALEDLRDLARGIYPPLLADKGLPSALEAQTRRAAVPTTLHAEGIGRYSQETEAAVYFCVLEALNNVAKYAEANRADIELAPLDEQLSFSVLDDGRGFDTSTTSYGTGLQGMADRLDAIGGRLSITSSPGSGTTITGRVPTRAVEPST